MKRRVFIAIHYMELGGAERSLLGLLENMNPDEYEIDLFVYSHRGELMKFIPEHVHLLPENPAYAAYDLPLIRVFCQGHFLVFAARLWAKFSNWCYNRKSDCQIYSLIDEVGRVTSSILPSLEYLGEYDVAISFLTPHYIVRDKVRARKKIAWIHTDYSAVRVNVYREFQVWASYDHIVSISPNVSSVFLHIFPSLASKLIEQENFLPYRLIFQQADEFEASQEMSGIIRLLSIGRFCPAKNFLGAVEIMSELCKLRDDVTWYLIGYGGEEMRIRRKIEHYGLENKFIILGKRANPYPYIKACDLYIQPSVYEGKSVAVKEAQLLGTPVAITRYPTAASQIQEGVDGSILPLGDPAATAWALHALLSEPEQMYRMAFNAAKTANNQIMSSNFVNILHS